MAHWRDNYPPDVETDPLLPSPIEPPQVIDVWTNKLPGEDESHYTARIEKEYAARMPPNAPPALLQRAKSFIGAMVSLAFQRATTQDEQDARLALCYACDAFDVAITQPELIGHCRACGCGKTKLSSLATKVTISASSCPKGLWVPLKPASPVA